MPKNKGNMQRRTSYGIKRKMQEIESSDNPNQALIDGFNMLHALAKLDDEKRKNLLDSTHTLISILREFEYTPHTQPPVAIQDLISLLTDVEQTTQKALKDLQKPTDIDEQPEG